MKMEHQISSNYLAEKIILCRIYISFKLFRTEETRPQRSHLQATKKTKSTLFLRQGLSHYVDCVASNSLAQAGLKFTIFLLQPPKCWDYRLVPPCPALLCVCVCVCVWQRERERLGFEVRASCLQSRHSTAWTTPKVHSVLVNLEVGVLW
jgi:hypothetical protein